jgi:hypothetical protein
MLTRFMTFISITSTVAILLSSPAIANDPVTIFEAQLVLNAHGYNVGDADGISGPATRAALQSFAAANDIEPTIMGLYSYALSQNLGQRQPVTDESFLASIQERVAENLKNPSSAQFRGIYSITGTSFVGDRETTLICGQVNGHNSYGGYAGFTYFYGAVFEAFVSPSFTYYGMDGPDNDLAEATCALTFSN